MSQNKISYYTVKY